jgi:hypothetical protein
MVAADAVRIAPAHYDGAPGFYGRGKIMATSQQQIERWFDEGIRKGSTHLITVCDTFDYEDYPVYVQPGEDARAVVEKHRHMKMQRVMEVYDLAKPKQEQFDRRVCWELPPESPVDPEIQRQAIDLTRSILGR